MTSLFLLLAAANPLLLLEADVPSKPIPFAQIQPEHVGPAIDAHLAEARKRLDAWKRQTAPSTFQNTVVAFRDLDRDLAFALNVVRTIDSTATTPAFQKAIGAAVPPAMAFRQSRDAARAAHSCPPRARAADRARTRDARRSPPRRPPE